jgi:sugar lactone lactonase YvrE
MRLRQPSPSSLLRLLALGALALAACAAPAAAPPTSTPEPPPTATALPPTAAATPRSTAASVAVPATSVSLFGPSSIAFDADGNMYVADCGDSIVVKIDPYGQLRTIAGSSSFNGGFSGDGGPAIAAEFNCPSGMAFDRNGNLYLSDLLNNRVRRIDRSGIISTVVGSDPGGFGGDGGPATSALLQFPVAIVIDSGSNLYIDDANNNRVRKVDRQGIITTIAGNGTAGFSGDGGPATAAKLSLGVDPNFHQSGMAIDAEGNLYIADTSNNRVRKVDQRGIITTVVGNASAGFSGDGGPATAAGLSRPTGLAFDAQGNLYVAEANSALYSDNRIRKVDRHGTITTVAGTGGTDFFGDGGPAVFAVFRNPWGIAFDTQQNLYIADEGNDRVRKVDQNGIITTVAGGRP